MFWHIKSLAQNSSYYLAILPLNDLWIYLIWVCQKTLAIAVFSFCQKYTCCSQQSKFLKKKKLPQNFMIFTIFLCKSHIWEIFGSWGKGWNAIGQSHCRILKSTLSLKKMKQKLDFLYVDTNSWTFEVDVNFVGGRWG